MIRTGKKDQDWSGNIRNGQQWSGMIRNNQDWSGMIRNDHDWSEIIWSICSLLLAFFYLLILTCYLLPAICYLLICYSISVTRYLLLVICYFLHEACHFLRTLDSFRSYSASRSCCFQFSWISIVRLTGVERAGGELDFRPEEDGSFQLAGNGNQKIRKQK